MVTSLSQQSLLRRYRLLSCLFGTAFGFRFTLDVWVIQHFAQGSDPWHTKWVYVLFSLVGMAIGELLGAIIAEHRGRVRAVRLAGGLLVLWAFCAALGVGLVNTPGFYRIAIFYIAGGGFGMAFGLWHSTLDAWLDSALAELGNRKAVKDSKLMRTQATDVDLLIGSFLYNAGFFIGAALAFPALTGFNLRADLKTSTFQSAPYLLASLPSIMLLLTGPRQISSFQVSTGELRRARNQPLRALGRSYRAILGSGGWGILLALFIGGSISLLIQYNDLFAAEIFSGTTSLEKATNVSIYNVMICVSSGIFGWIMSVRHGRKRLKQPTRGKILGVCLTMVIVLFLALLQNHSPTILVLVFGLIQCVLILLPPLVKAWMLDFALGKFQTSAQSALGLTKRLFSLIPTAAILVALNSPPDQSSAPTLYKILIVIASLALVAVAGGSLLPAVVSAGDLAGLFAENREAASKRFLPRNRRRGAHIKVHGRVVSFDRDSVQLDTGDSAAVVLFVRSGAIHLRGDSVSAVGDVVSYEGNTILVNCKAVKHY